uniref:Tn3 family transposase n=1 Tax=uncultured Fibrella sp. TaxID=1284596 RepID=UPI0035C97D4D
MARREYLSPEERIRFDTPPTLTSSQRLILFDLPQWAEDYLENISRPTNRVGFVLQLGYFRVTTRFFELDGFADELIEWVCEQLRLPVEEVILSQYVGSGAVYHHRKFILRHLGYAAFSDEHIHQLAEEARRLSHLQTRPTLLLDALTGYLREQRIEIPSYNALRSLLTDALDAYQDGLEALIDAHLTPEARLMLEGLLQKQPPLARRRKMPPDAARQYYSLTTLKAITQSMKPHSIAERVELFSQLKAMFIQLAPLIVQLNLSDDTIQYYAQYVLDTRSAQSVERLGERYLRLIAFIVYQYLTVGDALVLSFQQAVTALVNEGEQELKETLYAERQGLALLVGQVIRRSDTHLMVLAKIEAVLTEAGLTDEQKVRQIEQLINQQPISVEQRRVDKQRLEEVRSVNQPLVERDDYYDALEKISLRLQTRVARLVAVLVFDDETPTRSGWLADLLVAIRHMQTHQEESGTGTGLPPLEFLTMDERQRVFTGQGRFRQGLYKVLLFRHIQAGLQCGQLNVLSSFEFRAVEDYQIPLSQWQAHRQTYLVKANLLANERPAPALLTLNERLNQQYARTNSRLTTNPQLYFDKAGSWHLHRYEADDPQLVAAASRLYPTSQVIALRDVLEQVQGTTGFLEAFTHQGFPSDKATRPDPRLFLAAIIGFGENIGIRKMGLISKSISVNSLETVATHYFSPEGVLRANDRILEKSNQLVLTDHFRRKAGFIHTGSDGQKYDVSGPLLRAAASFKYFGNGQGITIYSHLDEAGQLIYSVVFSAADRESTYMLDAITYNEVITPDAHSTDTHGSTEAVFGVTGLLGIDFRPRFARIHHQQLYSLDAASFYRKQGYRLVPDGRIDYENLVEQWDAVLRFVASIKLGYVKASQLFKRLNSYDRQHPLYRALVDLGRLYKSDYILRYVDDPALRAGVEGILTRVEHANRFAKAIVLGNNQAFGWVTYHEQLVA